LGSRAREQILSKIERSLGIANGDPARKEGEPGLVTQEWIPIDAPWDEARKEIEALSDQFHMLEHTEDLRRLLAGIVGKHDVSLAVRWDHPLLEELRVDEMLHDCGVETRIPSREEEWKELSARAQLGITTAEALVMESGTLVLRAGKEWGRSTSLLPPVHLAIVQADQRLKGVESLPLLFRFWARENKGLPSAITLVTGHSRTADIELTLVSGVHGPGTVYVVGLSSK